jgi:hypothetical protein
VQTIGSVSALTPLLSPMLLESIFIAPVAAQGCLQLFFLSAVRGPRFRATATRRFSRCRALLRGSGLVEAH